jgi:competence protein ComEC
MQSVRAPGFWQAPLAPAALAATAGVVADRYGDIPLEFSLVAVAACLAAWACTFAGRQGGLAFLYLLGAVAALGAAYHHGYREVFAADDIGAFAPDEPRPAVLRGAIEEEPTASPAPPHDPLRSFDRRVLTRTVLRVTSLRQREGWVSASGLARVMVIGGLKGEVHVGDEVELVGRLVAPRGPSNPGESDYASAFRDKRIRAVVIVREAPDSVRVLAESSPLSPASWLAQIRGWAHRTLEALLPPEQKGLAMALLLGENYMLGRADWDKYQRTGVIHVLAISGQHLSILAGFFWLLRPRFFLRRRPSACVLALFLLAYALLAGGRPPVMRPAVMVCAVCVGVLLRRNTWHANLFALAWLAVLVLNPTDIFDAGCQLSFLAVAILTLALPRPLTPDPNPTHAWGLQRRGVSGQDPLQELKQDPLQELIEKSRPAWEERLRSVGSTLFLAYKANLAVWLGVGVLVAARFNLISLAGAVIGPPVALLASVALLAGFFALVLATWCWPLAQVAAWLVSWGLAGCDALVTWSERWPGAYWYVPDVPEWWAWGFYVVLLAALTVQPLRRRWRQVSLGLLAWLCLGLMAAARPPAEQELRFTFLAVGHGGCAVLETPDGRVLLYDAGATGGPDVTRQFIAPYLWSRGVRRVDEVFLSHA